MARRVGRLAVALSEPLARAGAERNASPAHRVAYPYRPRPLAVDELSPDEETAPGENLPPGEASPHLRPFLPISAWVVDLALRAAGYAPVALRVPGGKEADDDALGAEAERRGAAVLALPGTVEPLGSGEADSGDNRWFDDRQFDVAAWRLVGLEGAPVAGTTATPSATAAPLTASLTAPLTAPLTAARRLLALGSDPVAGKGGTERTEVAVAGRGPADAGDQLLLAWSLLTGGVLVLEANPAARVATAAWSRPTVFVGDAGEVEHLRREAEEWEGRWRGGAVRRALRRLGGGGEDRPGLPFGRLHTLVVRGGGAPGGAGEGDFWASRGVRRVDLASLVQ